MEHFVKMSVVAVDEEEKGGQWKKERKRGAGGGVGGCNDGGRRETGPTGMTAAEACSCVFNFGKNLVLFGF